MRANISNNSNAIQGIWTDEGLRHIGAGKTATLTIADDYVERALRLPFLKIVAIDPLDHDEDGGKGGSKASRPTALSNKSKADLLEIVAAENVPDVSEDMTNEDIRSAIELHREAKG